MKTESWVLSVLGLSVMMAGGGLVARRVGSARAAARVAAAVSAAAAHGGVVLRVAHVNNAITLDGDTDDPGWLRPPAPRTGGFLLSDGRVAMPYSMARAVWGDGYLYLSLYAADNDIESRTDTPDGPLWLDDAFRVVFSKPGVEYAIDVSPRAVITDSIRRGGGAWDFSWSSGAHASKELDGSLNHPDDMDEEWGVELAAPLKALGLKGEPGESIRMTLSRCDTPKGEQRICAGWGAGWGHDRGTIVLE